jgi:hypothetical protein
MARDLQFSTGYMAREDRLLLRGTFPDDTEIGLLFTRRLTRRLLQGLDKLAMKMVKGGVAVAPEAKQQVADFSRELAIDQADFSRDYVKGRPHPLMAEGPRLVTQAVFTPKPSDRVGISFKLDKGEQVKFTLSANALWSLGHLLARQAERAEWNLGAPREAPESPGTPAARRLN